jgi:hypothetical protein
VADVWEEKTFVDGDVGGVLVGGGVDGALIGVSFPPHVRLTTLLLVVISFFPSSSSLSCHRPYHYHLYMEILQ